MDDYEVKLTGQAQRQLQEIVRYIAEDLQEPATAARMLDSMEKEIKITIRSCDVSDLTEDERRLIEK